MTNKIVNLSGLKPLEYNILVKPKEATDHLTVSPLTGKTLRIIKPDDMKDRERISATEGTVIAVSPSAFDYVEDPQIRKLVSVKPGDTVVFPRHNAMEVTGDDGEKYFIMKDKCIAAVFGGVDE